MPTVSELSYFGMSDIGHVRTNNEDAFVLMPEHGFFAIADGMGGHNGGEIAAHETLSHLSESVTEAFTTHTPTPEETEKWLCESIAECNAYVHKLSRCNTSLTGMGTTICMTLFLENELIYAHVGDSRLYHFHGENLAPLTSDHSLVNKVAKEENISPTKARQIVKKGIITRSIGTHRTVKPEIETIPYTHGDTFLLCTDGLTDLVPDEMIEKILLTISDLEEATQNLIELAKSRGGRDNITVILIRNNLS